MKDGRSRRIGTDADVAWIADSTHVGLAITSAIPPIFEAYATIILSKGGVQTQDDRLAVEILANHSVHQLWWLGFLRTGASDIIFPDAPRVTLYANWEYVFVEAGPVEALTWRDESSHHGPLPDVVFPDDRSWMLSTLWDDDWRCLGGRKALTDDFLAATQLSVRSVTVEQDMTPPGHTAR